MKRISIFFTLIALVSLASCDKDTEQILIDSSQPQGNFAVSRSGAIVEQNGTGSKGLVQLGTDGESVQFVKLGSDFMTNLATGTVTVYLSTSEMFKADPGNGNPDLRLIGTIAKNGESYFKIEPAAPAKFNHLILWCGSANVPFGYAKLQ